MELKGVARMLSYPEVLGWAGPELVWRAAPNHQVATQNTSHTTTFKNISNNAIREWFKKSVEKTRKKKHGLKWLKIALNAF